MHSQIHTSECGSLTAFMGLARPGGSAAVVTDEDRDTRDTLPASSTGREQLSIHICTTTLLIEYLQMSAWHYLMTIEEK